MTAMSGTCDICGFSNIENGRPTGVIVGVACVPSFPVSLAWCRECLFRGVMPMFCVESLLCDDDLDLLETIQKWGLDMVLEVGAEWFMESWTWIGPATMPRVVAAGQPPDYSRCEGPGRYVVIKDYLKELGSVIA